MLILLVSLTSQASAETVPSPGLQDPRIRTQPLQQR